MPKLQDVRGIGNTIEAKLNDAGITSINQLANAELDDLTDENIPNAETILERARKMGAEVKDGARVEREQEDPTFVSTGMQLFDQILGGGLQGGFLVGISGEHKAGKTQLALQTLASAADFTDGNAVYIETEPNRFQISRVKSLCRKEDSYRRIHKVEAYDPDPEVDNLELQHNAYDAVRETFDNLSLVVVDSFVSNFRLSNRFEGRGDLKERSNIISRHLSALQALANDKDCPVVVTLQVYGNPNQYDSTVPVWGGALMHHTLSYLIHMAHNKGELREAQLRGHPAQPDDKVVLKIPPDAPIVAVE